MFPSFSSDDRTTIRLLAGAIAVMLVLGAVLVFVKSGDDAPSPEEVQEEQQRQEQERLREADEEARRRAEQDRTALASIERQLEACRTKYLPAANERAEAARAQLRELQTALTEIVAQLPPGRAKDTLSAQLGPDVASAEQLIHAEQRSLETRCRMAFTIFQYTRDSPPAPPP